MYEGIFKDKYVVNSGLCMSYIHKRNESVQTARLRISYIIIKRKLYILI